MKFDSEINPILTKISSISEPAPTRAFSFEKGSELFERKKYFECHEVFEFQWKKESGNWRLYTQAIIQLAISLNKVYHKPNIRGSRMQAEKALEKLNRIPTEKLTKNGLNTIKLLKENLESLLDCYKTLEPNYKSYKPPKIDPNCNDIFKNG